jgi:hypothetical protein
MQLRSHTDTEWEELPHGVLTSDNSWDLAVYDSVLTEDDTWYDAIDDFANEVISYDVFDQYGKFKPCEVYSARITDKTELISDELHVFHLEILYRNNFLQVPTETMKRTFEPTTQFARSEWITRKIYNTQ